MQDLLEKPLGNSADERNHVRFWLTKEAEDSNRPLWPGSASFDR